MQLSSTACYDLHLTGGCLLQLEIGQSCGHQVDDRLHGLHNCSMVHQHVSSTSGRQKLSYRSVCMKIGHSLQLGITHPV
jgi:hypothetical protein